MIWPLDSGRSCPGPSILSWPYIVLSIIRPVEKRAEFSDFCQSIFAGFGIRKTRSEGGFSVFTTMEVYRSRLAAMSAFMMALLVMIILLAGGAAAAVSPSPSPQAGGAASSYSLPSLAALLIAPLVAYCIY